MKKCVEITIDTETGSIHVMECAPKEEMGEAMAAEGDMPGEMMGGEGGKMQDFEDMESALQYVAELLTGETREGEADAMAAAQKGYGNKPRIGMGMEQRPTVGQVFGEE